MLIKSMILSNSFRRLFKETGNPIFYVASEHAKRGEDLTLPPVQEEQTLNL